MAEGRQVRSVFQQNPASANQAMNWAIDGTGLTLKNLHFTVGTGYGRVNVPFADKAVTEIACHARGANCMYGSTIRTVLDMGGHGRCGPARTQATTHLLAPTRQRGRSSITR
jgi:activator of 2-hydroxyglutaryl-CoA dehydratase